MNRRSFLKKGVIVGGSLPLLSYTSLSFRNSPARIGIIGTGLRGRWHLKLLLDRPDVEVTAICDIDPEALKASQELIAKSKKGKASEFTGNDFSYEEMLEKSELDGVIIATPWRWHTRMAVEAMKRGIYAGVEVPAAVTIEECWDLVNTYEQTGTPCMILENVCYRRDVMAIMNMVKQDLFGELIYLECGYQHDLRDIKLTNGTDFGEAGKNEAKWRTWHSVHRNGDLYPTHGLGPVATMVNVNRGNLMTTLTSSATKTRGLHEHIVRSGGEDHPNANVDFKLGDVVITVINCRNGEVITVKHDTNLPRPYSLGFRVQGTKGIWMDVSNSIYIEGRSPESHRWENDEEYMADYDHPYWKKFESDAVGAGHGGMDFFVVHEFINAVKLRQPPPLDVYDAASWSVISHLSEKSISSGGEPQDIPDFTRGRWFEREPVFGMNSY